MSYVLGLSGLYHDSAAVLLHDGKVVAAAGEERFSRVKHDAGLPVLAARWCLQHAGIAAGDLTCVVWYEKPLRKFERILVTQVAQFPRSARAFRRSTFNWLTDKLWVKSSIVTELGVPPEKVLFSDHHQSHAASAFYASPFSEAAVLTVDGVGEWATTSLYRAGPGGLEPLAEILFPDSIGLVYSAFTAYLGFQVNDGEYKVMGMAAYGQPRYEAEVRRVLRLQADGAYDVDLDYVSYHWSAEDSFTPALARLLGPPRFPGAPFDPTTPEGQRYADIAASVQKVTEDALVGLAGWLHARTGLENLCLAGGVALNSVANRQLLLRGPFARLYVQPAAGDAGGAMGAALWAWHEVLGNPRAAEPVALSTPGLGQAWSDDAIGALLADLRVKHEAIDPEQVPERAAADLAEGKVLGWFQGRFEWGPRALGHRSILADPRRADMTDRINAKIKFREAFRPFAPSVRAGDEARYFDVPPGGELLAEWMLLVAPVRTAELPATTHADGTARLHVVRFEANPLFHSLLDTFGDATGHPVLLNTSFNLKGEPIVASPVQALATFFRSGLDALYLGSFRVEQSQVEG
ncbi:MAG: carbamoyltransferase N-terminal domain-containing protein [Pseudomonadota bacterium]|nr:carbamoyltransferase N-terminal domain-containing protein [Pseudomonadota bacterium]